MLQRLESLITLRANKGYRVLDESFDHRNYDSKGRAVMSLCNPLKLIKGETKFITNSHLMRRLDTRGS
jgi:hypothetical protein